MKGLEVYREKRIRHQADRSLRYTAVRLEQSEKASLPMLVTPSGMTMLVRLRQESNALLPISVRLEGRVTFVRLEQP